MAKYNSAVDPWPVGICIRIYQAQPGLYFYYLPIPDRMHRFPEILVAKLTFLDYHVHGLSFHLPSESHWLPTAVQTLQGTAHMLHPDEAVPPIDAFLRRVLATPTATRAGGGMPAPAPCGPLASTAGETWSDGRTQD